MKIGFWAAVLAVSGCSSWRGFGGTGFGASGGGGVELWALPSWGTVFPDTPAEPENAVFARAERAVRLEAGINECVAFQLAFRSRARATIASVSLDALRSDEGTIGPEHLRLYREHDVAVDAYPSWFLRLTPWLRERRAYPDILVPLEAPQGGLPIRLSPGRSEAVWVDVHVPPGTPSGRYTAQIRVRLSSGTLRTLLLMLDVHPFALPTTRHLNVLAGLDTEALFRTHLTLQGQPYAPPYLSLDDPVYPQATATLDEAVRLLHEHRCTAILSDIRPRPEMDERGRSVLDFADYDRLVTGIVDGSAFGDRVPVNAWPLPVNDRQPPPVRYGGWNSRGYELFLVSYLRGCAAHFQARGWFDRHFVWIPLPVESPAERYREFLRLGRLIRQADPRLRAVCPLPPRSLAGYGQPDRAFIDVSDLAEIWAPRAHVMDPAGLADQRRLGKTTWFQPDRPPFSGSLSVVASPTDARVLAWLAFRYELEGILIGQVNRWSGPDPSREDPRRSAVLSAQSLIWPGKPYGLSAPVPSVRLKRLRRGLQDYEYLWLLARNRRPGIARLIAEDLVTFAGVDAYGEHWLDGRPGGWVRDPAAWELARRLMARELIDVVEGVDDPATFDEAQSIERFQRQIQWARLTQAVRAVRTTVEGVRVTADVAGPAPALELKIVTSTLNATREPVSGTLSLDDPPEGLTVVPPGVRIDQLPPRRLLRQTMRVRADRIAPNVEGIIPLTIATAVAGDQPRFVPGRLCWLSAQPISRTLTLDGRLDDWPLGAGNVAGDFLLVGARDVPKRGREDPTRPAHSTTCFVTFDEQNLYVAFDCHDAPGVRRTIPRDNLVHYDGLWPTGDDLVEIVIDPTGEAVGPEDLLHIVVKLNGAVIAEQGFPPLRSVAACRAWPGRVRAAVDDRTHPDRWSVEIAIPLDALAPRRRLFGFNVARYNPWTGEYACWSGAPRHLYSPTTLGNMILPYRP